VENCLVMDMLYEVVNFPPPSSLSMVVFDPERVGGAAGSSFFFLLGLFSIEQDAPPPAEGDSYESPQPKPAP